MDKRKEANLRVKKNITEALFALMDKKDFSKITVTDIIEEAKVARASFYRNYESKEDLLARKNKQTAVTSIIFTTRRRSKWAWR